jgi:hypothetical protein
MRGEREHRGNKQEQLATAVSQPSPAQRKPTFPVDESGVDPCRAATR